MRVKIILLFLCFVNFSYSQGNNSESNLSFEINFSPNHNYRILSYEPAWQGFVDSREQNEKPSYGYNLGISIEYKIKNRFKFDCGIQYAQEGSQFVDVPLSTNNGSGPGVATSKYKYYYIEIPIRINYLIVDGSFVLNGILGISPKYFIHSRNVNYITFDKGQKDKTVGKNILLNPNKMGLNALLGIGTYFSIDHRMQFNLEPIFRISLAPLTINSPIKQYNYSFGLRIGLKFRI